MFNEILPASDTLNIIAPSNLVAGRPYLIGAMVVIPIADIASGALGAVKRCGGEYEVTKTAALALATVGALVEWNPSTNAVIANGGGTGTFDLGFVTRAALAADSTVRVTLIGSPVTAN